MGGFVSDVVPFRGNLIRWGLVGVSVPPRTGAARNAEER